MARPERLIVCGLELALLALLAASCTKLESANDRFNLEGGSGGSSHSGSGGSSAATPSGGNTARGGSGQGGASAGSGGLSVDSSAGSGAGEAGSGGSAGSGDPCVDESGFQGLGCYTCEPRDIVSFENACSNVTCTPFGNSQRLPQLAANGELPALPAISAGMGGSSGTGGSAGAPNTGGSAGSGGGSAGSGGGSAGNGGGSATGVACTSLAKVSELVFLTGSSAAKPYLQQVAQQLAAQGVYLIYTSTGSCVGVDAILNGTPMTSGSAPAPAVTATYWDSAASTGKPCDLPSAGVNADLGISDVFAQTCPGFELANPDALSVRDAHGPIQTMAFVVPSNSKQFEISAQAAYLAFGFGKDAGILDANGGGPIWNDETLLFQRSASSGTQALLGAAIGVPPARFKGKPHKTSDEVAASLQNATASAADADKALGILAADYLVSNPLLQIRPLAFQDSKQVCAVYPDSGEKTRDKRNVRDGHYPLWGPLHLLYRVDSAGNPLNPANRQRVLDIVGYLAGSKTLPNGVSLLDVYAQNGLVPECAMRVTRTKDGGNLLPFRPAAPCGCSFERRATGSTQCTPCTVQGECQPGETCSLGYCEH
ncbi:MAG: hypothetical protein ACOY0T_16880 [Myxococcota bacterium]